MKLTALSVDGFKNLKGVSLIPDPSYNLILGENAQGKTNLLEAIWTLTGCRSFRGTRERDYLPFSGGYLQVEAKFQDARREQSVRLCMVSGTVPEKKIWCNDVPQKSSALFSVFHCVTFTPEDLSLVEGGPERRRTFLDLCSAQLHAPMLGLVRRYQLDDLLLAIDGKPAKEFGSQGQKKSLALALKLAQAEIYSKRRKESPVVLLDDVMGELDEARQAVVSTIVQEMQVFVTTCHPESLLSPKNGKRFLLKDGMLTGDVENCPETA